MPFLTVNQQSDLSPGLVLSAARDFSERRAVMWPDVHVEYMQIHEVGDTHIEVTEGNPWPIGHVWERIRYDWSDSRALRGTVVDSNLFWPGSTWELWATPCNGGSLVEVRAMRHLRGRGRLRAPFFLPIGSISAASSVTSHLQHFLANIEPDNYG